MSQTQDRVICSKVYSKSQEQCSFGVLKIGSIGRKVPTKYKFLGLDWSKISSDCNYDL